MPNLPRTIRLFASADGKPVTAYVNVARTVPPGKELPRLAGEALEVRVLRRQDKRG